MVKHLALQICIVHYIKIDEPERAYTRRGQVQSQGRSKTTRAHAQHARALQFLLAFERYFRHDEVTRIAQNLFVA